MPAPAWKEAPWLYIVAPLIGAAAAVWLHGRFAGERPSTGCAKLYHTERYQCIFSNCGYSRFVAGSVVLRVAGRLVVLSADELAQLAAGLAGPTA